jgi:heme A synthase
MRRSDPYFRPGACKRRRDVLMVLVCALTITGLIGVIPAMRLLLAVTAFVGVALTAYVALLIRLRNHALEREAKLRYLPQNTHHDIPLVIRRAASR